MPTDAPPAVLEAPPSVLDAALLRRIVIGFRDALHAHRSRIDSLNVYPVPDGDTGTNMALTLQSVTDEIEAADDDMESLCQALAHGALMGARGNSGVIMAQILRGISSTVREAHQAGAALDAGVAARALSTASEGAYGAVGNPVEGTILTVVREASEAAGDAAAAGAGLPEMFDAAGERGYDALARTPQMLDVLAAAGVVDAGGAGLLLMIDAARFELSGRAVPEPPELAEAPHSPEGPQPAAADGRGGGDEGSSIADLRYEVMFLLDADDGRIDGFKQEWAAIGDSIVVVGGDGIWNCHVHTDDIGAAIEAGIAVGRPRRIRVTDLLEEVAERDWVRTALGEAPQPSQPPQAPHLQAAPSAPSAPEEPGPPAAVEITEAGRCAAVAVGAGDGVREILSSLGAHRVVSGGQSMNPSTADLLAAVDSVAAGSVVVVPNNSNIIPVAEQLDSATERRVSVVPTRSVVEGIASLLAFDPGADAEANRVAMTGAAAEVTAGEVTRAVRDAVCPVGPIKAGDWLGIGPDGISQIAVDETSAATGLLSDLVSEDHELLTVITGADAADASAAAIVAHAGEHHPDLEVEVQRGGQPLYPYYFGLE